LNYFIIKIDSEMSELLTTPQICVSFLRPDPEEREMMSFKEVQAMLRQRVEETEKFSKGSVLDTLERGVLYPVIYVDWLPKEEVKERKEKRLYEEVDRIEPRLPHSNSLPRFFTILSIFKSSFTASIVLLLALFY